MELHSNEKELILLIRNKCRYGNLEIITRDGLPERVVRTTVYDSVKFSSE